MSAEFNTATAVKDFAGERRWITTETSRNAHMTTHRMRLFLDNGWQFSAVWGAGSYCSGCRNGLSYDYHPPAVSPDAEVAVWKGRGPMIQLDNDTVAGWVSPAAFLAAVKAAERDDEDGIRAALTAGEDSE